MAENKPTPEALGIIFMDETEEPGDPGPGDMDIELFEEPAQQGGGNLGIEFEVQTGTAETDTDLKSFNDLGSLVGFDLVPEPGTYKTDQTITVGESGYVRAKVSVFKQEGPEILDSITGAPLRDGELVVEIGSAGPITWESFKMLHEQSGGEYSPGITISSEDLG